MLYRSSNQSTPMTRTREYKRRKAERRGRLGEWIGILILVLHGYRILGRRVRTPAGEIDLIGVRGGRLAFVEVKVRAAMPAARQSIGRDQMKRLARGAEWWTWRHPAFREYQQGLDAIYLAPGAWPVFDRDALQPL